MGQEQQHHQDKEAVYQHAIAAQRLQALIEQGDHRGTDQGAGEVAHTAEEQHGHEHDRLRRFKGLGADKAHEVRVHGAGKAGEYGADGKRHDLVPLNVHADAAGRHRVLPHRQERPPHPGFDDPLLDQQEQGHHHDHEHQEPEVILQGKPENRDVRDPADAHHGVGKRSPGEHDVHQLANRDRQQRQEMVNQLGGRKRHNDAQNQGHHARSYNGQPDGNPQFGGQKGRGICAGGVKSRMAQGNLSRIAEENIQARNRDHIHAHEIQKGQNILLCPQPDQRQHQQHHADRRRQEPFLSALLHCHESSFSLIVIGLLNRNHRPSP